MVNNVGNAILV